MKKVKFTLGLALSMLFLGANVSNAAYDNSKPNNGSIRVAAYIKACEFYAGDGVTLHQVAADPAGKWHANLNYPNLGAGYASGLGIQTNDAASGIYNWAYGYNITNPYTGRTVDYYLDTLQTSPTYNDYIGTGLFYYHAKNNATVYNRLKVQLGYVNGNELMPVIKRTITYGKWTYNANQDRNNLTSINVTQIDYLIADSSWFKPYMDRKSGIATYIYHDQVKPMLDKEVIYSIDYEISVHDEVASPGNNDYTPPVMSDVTILRGVKLEAENGITTNPISEGDKTIVAYTPSHEDYTFKAFSNKPIVVTTDRGRDAEGVKVLDNKDGSFDVTIRRVQTNIVVSIKSASTESGTGEDGTTGNPTISGDAVWAANGTLYVQTANPATVSVYGVTGQLNKQAPVNGSYSVSMPKGIYIIQLNGKAYKVVL